MSKVLSHDAKVTDSEQQNLVLPDKPQAWEQITEGAYLPHRTRGSWAGGVLG